MLTTPSSTQLEVREASHRSRRAIGRRKAQARPAGVQAAWAPSRVVALSILWAVVALAPSCAPGDGGDSGGRSAEEAGGVDDEDFARLVDAFQGRLDALRDVLGFPGAVATVILTDGRGTTVATGVADKESGTSMPLDAVMPAGSVGKTFVAMVAMALQSEGKLSLDDPVSKWLGDEDFFDRLPNHETMTVRHLLTHSSGVVDHVRTPEFAEALRSLRGGADPDRDAFLSPREAIALVLDREPLFPAGEGYRYSDTGYLLAGLVLEAASGRSFYQEAVERFISPLELGRTRPQVGRQLPGLVPGYAGGGGDYSATLGNTGLPDKVAEPGVMAFNPSSEWTGGGFVSNPQDLAMWAFSVYQGGALPFDYRQDLFGSGYRGPDRDEGVAYGLGVFVHEERGRDRVGHGGYFPGYNTSMYYYPEHGFVVALQVNTSVDSPGRVVQRELAAVVLDHLAEGADEARDEDPGGVSSPGSAS